MTLHWLIALLVLTNLGLGIYMADLPRTDTSRFAFFQLHKSIGLTVLLFSVMRVGWRLANPIPPLPRGLNPLLRFAGHASHFLLYCLIVAVPLAGWAVVSSSPIGLPTSYFHLFAWPNISYLANMPTSAKVANEEILQDTHAVLAYSALGLVVLHVLAALYHQYLRRDDVLKRMLPGTDVSDPA